MLHLHCGCFQPRPSSTDGEASNPGPTNAGWLDEPDDAFGDEQSQQILWQEQPEDFAYDETCLLNDAAIAQDAERAGTLEQGPMVPTWMGDSGLHESVLPH